MTRHRLDSPLDDQIRRHLPAAANGDRTAYGHLVRACQNSITGIALAHVRDIATSEDIAQEAFLKAWQHLGHLHNPDSFLPWLRQITRNLARDHLRASRRRRELADDPTDLIAGIADGTPCPAERHDLAERQRIASDILDRLPDDTREILLLYYREGQSSRQVAILLGLSDDVVRKRLSRARTAIRTDYIERLGEFARSSAPSAAFAGSIAAALALASPPAAAASLLAGGAAATGQTLLKAVTASLGSAAIGLFGAFAGIFWGLKRQLRGSIDQRERRELTRSAWINAGATVVFLLGIVATRVWSQGWLMPVLVSLAFFATILWQSAIVQPRILQRRHALEARIDPEGAQRRRRRERILCGFGILLGLVCGGGGLIYGLILSGRL